MIIEHININKYCYGKFRYISDYVKDSSIELVGVLNDDELIAYGAVELVSKKKLIKIMTDDYGNEYGDEIYTELSKYDFEEVLYIHSLEVDELYRNKGVGSNLFGFIRNNNSVIVLQSVEDSELFWDKLGFEDLFAYFKYLK